MYYYWYTVFEILVTVISTLTVWTPKRRVSLPQKVLLMLPDIDIDIDIDNGHHAQSDFICLANALHSSIGQTIISRPNSLGPWLWGTPNMGHLV